MTCRMDALAETLATVDAELRPAVADALDADDLRRVGDTELIEVLALAARVRRRIDAVIIEAVGHVLDRAAETPTGDGLTTRFGCRSTTELLTRAMRVSRRAAGEFTAAARAVRQETTLSGEKTPAEFPALRRAVAAGDAGVDAVLAITTPLPRARAGRAELLAADEELAACTRGEGVDAAPPATPDDLRQMAHIWAMYIDPDGAEPREARAMRRRGLLLGHARDGLVPVRGHLLPEVAAQMMRGFDSLLNPKVGGVPAPGPRFVPADGESAGEDEDESPSALGEADVPAPDAADTRRRAQKQHDALAMMLSAAVSSLPTLGGAAPVLVVSVREEDLRENRGFAHVSGSDAPVPLSVARHVACAGAVQRVVTGENGRIVSIATQERIFGHRQRRAIILRDGTCVTPGCHVPAEWCEIHHVQGAAVGGETSTDNGVALCWFHHRTIDTGGWQYRMNQGVPEVRGPRWWDARRQWRPVTTSPTRLYDRLVRRRR